MNLVAFSFNSAAALCCVRFGCMATVEDEDVLVKYFLFWFVLVLSYVRFLSVSPVKFRCGVAVYSVAWDNTSVVASFSSRWASNVSFQI